MKRYISIIFGALMLLFVAGSAAPAQASSRSGVRHITQINEDSSDTVKIVVMKEFTPYDNIQRIDLRSTDSFIYKGEVMFGVTASHASLSTENAEYLTLLSNLSLAGYVTTIKPFGAYFYRDNKAVGARFGYVKYGGTIDSATLDLGETNDLAFDVPYVSLSSINYSYSIFHRSYAPLDKAGHFGAYAEIELTASNGESEFSYENDGDIRSSLSRNQSYTLSFNPGISAFFMHNVCASFSFQFGGFDYTRIRQFNEAGEQIGSRDSSQMKFMFNVFAVNFGITVHIW